MRVGRVVGQADVKETRVLFGLERVHVAGRWAHDKVLAPFENELSGFSRLDNTFCLEDFCVLIIREVVILELRVKLVEGDVLELSEHQTEEKRSCWGGRAVALPSLF